MKWKKQTIVLKDVLKPIERECVLKDNVLYKQLGVRWYGNGVFIREERTGKEIKAKKLFRVKEGDFIYNRLFAWKSSFAIVPKEYDGCYVSNEFPLFIVDNNIIEPEFLLNYILLPETLFYINRESGGVSSVSRKRFKEDRLLAMAIKIPSIEIQRQECEYICRLKKILAEMVSRIEIQKRHLSHLRQSLLQEAVTGRLTAAWREKNAVDESGHELLERIRREKAQLIKEKKIKKEKPLPPIKDEDIPFEIPDSWDWCRLGEICSYIGSGSTPRGGRAVYSEKGIYFLRSQNIYNTGLRLNGVSFISDQIHLSMASTTVKQNDVLLNITGGSIGRAALVVKNIGKANINQHVCIIRPISINNVFLHKFVLSPYFQRKILDSTTGAGREGLPKNNLEKFLIAIPSIFEQQEIVRQLEILLGYCDELEQEIQRNEERSVMLQQSILRDVFQQDTPLEGKKRKPASLSDSRPAYAVATPKEKYAVSLFLSLVEHLGKVDADTLEGVYRQLEREDHGRSHLSIADRAAFDGIMLNFRDFFNTIKEDRTSISWEHLRGNCVARGALKTATQNDVVYYGKGKNFEALREEYASLTHDVLVELALRSYTEKKGSTTGKTNTQLTPGKGLKGRTQVTSTG